MKEIKATKTDLLKAMKDIERKVEELSKRQDKVEKEIEEIRGTASENTEAIRAQIDEMRVLGKELDEVSVAARRKHLIFHGLEENGKEEEVERVVKDYIGTKLQIPDYVETVRAFRMGPYVTGKRRPILVELEKMRDKEHILAASRKRSREEKKESWITEDWPKKIREGKC